MLVSLARYLERSLAPYSKMRGVYFLFVGVIGIAKQGFDISNEVRYNCNNRRFFNFSK